MGGLIKALGTFAQVILACFLLMFIAVIVSLFPGGEEFLNTLVVNTLGEFKLFSVVSPMIDGYLNYPTFEFAHVWQLMLYAMLQAALEAVILGMCVAIMNDLCTTTYKTVFRNKRRSGTRVVTKYKYRPILQGGYLLPSMIGFVIGLVLIRMLGLVDEASVQMLLYAVATLGVMCLGIGLMLGRTSAPVWSVKGYVFKQVMKILSSACMAISIAGMVTVVLKAPVSIMNGGSVGKAVCWLLVMIGCIAVFEIVRRYSSNEN